MQTLSIKHLLAIAMRTAPASFQHAPYTLKQHAKEGKGRITMLQSQKATNCNSRSTGWLTTTHKTHQYKTATDQAVTGNVRGSRIPTRHASSAFHTNKHTALLVQQDSRAQPTVATVGYATPTPTIHPSVRSTPGTCSASTTPLHMSCKHSIKHMLNSKSNQHSSEARKTRHV